MIRPGNKVIIPELPATGRVIKTNHIQQTALVQLHNCDSVIVPMRGLIKKPSGK